MKFKSQFISNLGNKSIPPEFIWSNNEWTILVDKMSESNWKYTDFTSFTCSFHLANSSKPKVYSRRKKSNRLSQLRSSPLQRGEFPAAFLQPKSFNEAERKRNLQRWLAARLKSYSKATNTPQLSSLVAPRAVNRCQGDPESSIWPRRQQSERLSAHLGWQIVECCRGHRWEGWKSFAFSKALSLLSVDPLSTADR